MNRDPQFWALWCKVYDGPLSWDGRDAFEQIAYLESQLRQLQGLSPPTAMTSVPNATS
jgi:hypothetical protein